MSHETKKYTSADMLTYAEIAFIQDLAFLAGYDANNVSLGGGGYTVETPTGSLGQTVFTVSTEPVFVVYDGNTYFDGTGYTYTPGTITTFQPVNLYIRAFIPS